jgi:RNAse (barnase) inhibitor barstar
MNDKILYEIDGRAFTTLEGFFNELSNKVIPGATWDKNLDAFNDILRGGFGTSEEGFTSKWKNSEISKDLLGYTETVRQLKKRLQTCHPSNRENVAKELAEAENGNGPTVYECLIEIIQAHCTGGEEAEDGVELLLE